MNATVPFRDVIPDPDPGPRGAGGAVSPWVPASAGMTMEEGAFAVSPRLRF